MKDEIINPSPWNHWSFLVAWGSACADMSYIWASLCAQYKVSYNTKGIFPVVSIKLM